jgi:hypothetical protein
MTFEAPPEDESDEYEPDDDDEVPMGRSGHDEM